VPPIIGGSVYLFWRELRVPLNWLLGAGFLGFGVIFGSFLNVCIYRLPRGLSVVRPRSACPGCHAMIAWYDNIPVLSWLLLGGRCRHCKTPITPRYAVVELACGALFLLSFLRSDSWADAVKSCILSFLLLGLAFTDAETHLLPDAMTLSGLGAALLLSTVSVVPGFAFSLFPFSYAGNAPLTPMQLTVALGWRSLLNALTGAVIGAGVLYLIGWVYLKIRKTEGMGLGDVKLMAMVGAFVGPVLTLLALCTASLAGGAYGIVVLATVYRRRLRRYGPRLGERAAARAWGTAQLALRGLEVPFGVFLSAMSMISWFYGAQIVRAYLRLFSIGD